MINWIMDTMVSMTLLMALVLIIRKPVSHFFGAHIAYLLWAVPLARLFMPTLTLKAPAPIEAVVATPLISDIAIATPSRAATVSALASIDWMMIALVVWIGGAGILFISKLAAYFQFREDIVSDGQLVGQHGRIKILETAAVGGPLAFGLLEKYIAVPTHFFRDYAPRERELALEHEIAHHESGDLMANFVGLLVLSLHWFNPVAWYAWFAFRQDQETACDARVLQNGGHSLRAVYGRTIAKSVSGHQLGLVSPLNQKNKIKDRLKMLGQTEKSALRKRMGALMVGASTVVALPLTATVTYAVEVEAQPQEDDMVINSGDDDRKNVVAAKKNANDNAYFQSKDNLKNKKIAKDLKKTDVRQHNVNLSHPPVPPIPPMPSAVPAASQFSGHGQSGDTINITMLNGEKNWAKIRASGKEYVHKIKHNGRTVILRTNKKLSKDEIRNMVAEAEESRLEADENLRKAEIARQETRTELAEAAREMKQAEQEWEQERRSKARLEREIRLEVDRAMLEAQHETARAVREAERAASEAQRKAHEAQSVAARFWETSQITFKPYFSAAFRTAIRSSNTYASARSYSMSRSSADCAPINMGGMDDLVWSNIAECPAADKQVALTVALRGLENKRTKAAACNEKDVRQQAGVETFVRDIKTLRAQLSTT